VVPDRAQERREHSVHTPRRDGARVPGRGVPDALNATPGEPSPKSDRVGRYRISEIFLSLQGEGPSAGTPAHFVRLQGCDVGCVWCDTKYSWDASQGRELALEAVWEEARALGEAPMLVVTGGEPLEHPGIVTLLEQAVSRWSRVEVETSGIGPPPLFRENLFYNVSPKLPSATPNWERTWHHVAAWNAEPNATFKIVVGDDPDLEDALGLIRTHGIPAARVMLMPEGLTDEALRRRAVTLAEACKRQGLRMSPRLHVWMWGARRGV
jgi:organic radical activating enzyme